MMTMEYLASFAFKLPRRKELEASYTKSAIGREPVNTFKN